MALAVLPLLGVLAYSVEQGQELARSNEKIASRRLIVARVSAGVLDRLDRFAEYLRKYSVSEDPGYAAKLTQVEAAVQAELQALTASRLAPAETEALAQLMDAWERFRAQEVTALATDVTSAMDQLEHLTALAAAVSLEAKRSAETEASTAAQTRAATRDTAAVVATSAVVVSLVLMLMTVHRLRNRLDEFISATTAVSRGSLSIRLDVSPRDELGQLATSFNRMVSALQQLDRMKADFISSVSHELKTPLVAMLETNHLLLDEVPGPLTPAQQRMLKLNTQAAQRLSNMITDLLELSALKAAIRYKMGDHDLTTLTTTAIGEFDALARERGLALRSQLPQRPLLAVCDGDRFVQVVQNLLENACKYTPSGGRVELSLRDESIYALPPSSAPALASGRPRFAIVTVEDSGPGIPEADRERVFEKFFRRQGHASDGGVGLGLAICREIVEAHGGTIWVDDSEELGGTAIHAAIALDSASHSNLGSKSR